MGGFLSLIQHGFDQSMLIPAPTLTENNLPDQDGKGSHCIGFAPSIIIAAACETPRHAHELHPLRIKVFLITGANSGVGFELARILYSRHGTVYLACRSATRAQDAISRITQQSTSSRGKLIFLPLDLSDLSTIKPAVQQFLAREKRLDWLNHNAGVSIQPAGSKGAQGHDLLWVTNVLGSFLLTKLLLPTLQATARQNAQKGAVRVSWAGSFVVEGSSPRGGVGFKANTSVPEPKEYGHNTYAVTKTANLFLCHEFARRKADQVLHNCYNPGNLQSNLLKSLREMLWFLPFIFWMVDYLVLFPAVMGAYTELYCGLSQDLKMPDDQACYVIPWGRKVGEDHLRRDLMENIGEGKGSGLLWEWCERETSPFL